MFQTQTNVVLVKEIMVFSNKPHNDLCLFVVQTGKVVNFSQGNKRADSVTSSLDRLQAEKHQVDNEQCFSSVTIIF